MKRKEAVYTGLDSISVYYDDNSLTSPDYFQISEFPLRLTSGKNLFKLRGNPTNLKPGSIIGIEVLDYNGDPIYYEVVDYIDEDKSRIIAIYVYDETSPGDCTITVVGEAVNINNVPTPTQWQGKTNIRWTRTVPVNPNVSNDSEIIFEQVPTIDVTEQIGVQLNRTYNGGQQFPTYSTGKIRYFSYNGQPAMEISGGLFTAEMSTGTVTVTSPINTTPTPNYTVYTSSYTSTIKKILSPSVALLDTEYTAYSSQSVYIHTFTEFDYSTYSIDYEATPTYVTTENSQSFALLQINNLQPATGDVSRIKVYTNNNGTVSTWELVNDVELQDTEIFIANTASLYPDQSIGIFSSQSIIDTYWDAKTYLDGKEVTPTTLQWTTSSMSNAMLISSSINLSARNSVQVAQLDSLYAGTFLKDASYKITLDALGTNIDGNAPILSLYLSGSSFYQDPTDYFNQAFPKTFGKRIGQLTINTSTQRFDDEIFSFEADYDGNGVLLIVVESGEWQVSDIHVTTDADSGYSPNYTRIKTPIQTTHKIDNQISFKVEYYNVAGVKSKQISYLYNKDWEGGNRYIDGNYSMLTGSLYVADSLESGIAISGYPNSGFVRSLGYEGFESGFPGFLLWSGSALPGQNTKGGVPYSGVGLELYANTSSYFRYSTANSEIDVRTDKFFFGNPSSSFISGSNGLISISSSNFILSQQGNITASNADFRGTALADIITDRSVSITTANSSSYINYYSITAAQSASRLYLDGSLGGQKVRRITFNCNLKHPIGKITTPGQKLEVILTNQYDYAVPPPSYTGPYNVSLYDIFTPSDPSLGVVSYDIKSIPAGDTVIITNTDVTTDAKLQTGGSITLFDHTFSSNVTTKTLTTSQSFYATIPIINSTRTITSFTSSIYLVDTTSASVTLTLPGGPAVGTTVTFKKIGGTNSLILNPGGTTPIDGALTKTTTDASASIQLLYQGTTYNYLILSAYGTWT